MSVSHSGQSVCSYCGATYHLFSIFNRDMQGLTKGWKRRHEFSCRQKTPQQRLKWAKKYIGKDCYDSAITVDLEHPGFVTQDIAVDLSPTLKVLCKSQP